ncbi:MAG: TIGR01777 family oxidoreductase [Chitinophagaceae bacterium]|nr:TIGR01777 family oxidoreductase [Chitinophagaceae bacterium]
MKPKLVIAAANGFLGNALIQKFKQNYEVVCLVRKPRTSTDEVRYVLWDGKNVGDWKHELANATALINLAGRSINCRYTEENKQAILHSRLESTRVLGEAIQQLQHKPKIWMNCSSVTLYEHSFDTAQDEFSTTFSEGFSTDVCKQWEAAFTSFTFPAVRQLILRIAVVLGKNEGALKPLVPLTKLGLGGKSGSGLQQFSWIHIDDFCNAISFLIEKSTSVGAFNMCSPQPVTNGYFMRALRQVLRIPFGLPQPAWVVKLGAMLIGTEAELVLESRYVVPTRLTKEGFTFSYPEIKAALQQLLL